MGNTQLFVQPSASAASPGRQLGIVSSSELERSPSPGTSSCGRELLQERLLELAWRSPLPCPFQNFKETFLESPVTRGGKTRWVATSLLPRLEKVSLCCGSVGSLKGQFLQC